MEDTSVKEVGVEVDLESGLVVVTKDDSKNVSTPGNTKQGKTLFDKFSCGLVVGDSRKGAVRHSVYLNKSNLGSVCIDIVKVSKENTLVKEKRKKSSNKKAAKPPRPPRSPSLDAADQKLIREITELAMLKRARIERMKALKKMKAAKSSSSSSSSMFAMIFTVVFCIVILLQGMSPGKSSVKSFQEYPVSAGGEEGGLILARHQFYPSSNDPNAPGLESQKIVQQVTGSDSSVKLR